MLHQAFVREWPAVRALSRAANEGGGLPEFIETAAEHYLKCGILRYGFVHARCDRCSQSIVVAFSCKQRGLCNSCDGKRMTSEAAHLVDEVIPAVPVRQWVLTFPFDLRYLLAWHASLRAAVLSAFMRALQAHYRRQGVAQGGQEPKYAAISVAQRFDASIRLNLHYHVLCADGVFVQTSSGLQFLPAPPLQQAVVEEVFADVLRRVARQVVRLLDDPDADPRDKLVHRDPAFAALLRNAMLGAQSAGKDAGKPQRVEFGTGKPAIKPHGRNCAQANGYSLHANTRVPPLDRAGLEKLCQYVCRPAIAAHRLAQVDAQTIRITLKSDWSGGVRAVLISPRDLVIRALAQVPLPRKPQIHYHGCFAPNAGVRSQVVPAGDRAKCRRKKAEAKPEETVEQACTRLNWAQCLKRAFLYEVLACPCGGRRKMMAAVQDGGEIERFLRHVNLWPESGDIVAIRGPPELFAVLDAEAPDPWEAIDPAPADDWAA